MLTQPDEFDLLRRECKGPVLAPEDADYHSVRRVWNGMIDRRPALIARCLDAADVSTVLRHARRQGRQVTVRGGGHNVAGASLADGAYLVDLSLMRNVTVDTARRVAVADGGCLLSDLDRATARHQLACPSGVVSHTGLGGLALGGGYGWLARKWGLTCDHIMGAEVVLADGSIVSVSESNEPDLLWALRGGGGQFGIVTRFSLALRPVSDMYVRQMSYPLEATTEVLNGYRHFAENQSSDLHAVAAFKYSADSGRWGLSLTTLWLGAPSAGPTAVEPLADEVTPATSVESVVPYLALQARGDHSEPAGNRYYTKSCYLSELPDEVAARLASAAPESPSPHSSIDLEFLMGAIAEPPADTAFPHREAPYMCTASAQWTDPADDRANAGWARRTIDDIGAWHYGGAYVNYVQEATDPGYVYGPQKSERLAELKSRYDPTSLLGPHLSAPGL